MKRLRMETTLPCDGSWTISESKGTAYCQSYTYVNHTWFIRTLQFDSTDKVLFLLNGKKILPREMIGHSSSFQVLNETISKFHAQSICQGVIGGKGILNSISNN